MKTCLQLRHCPKCFSGVSLAVCGCCYCGGGGGGSGGGLVVVVVVVVVVVNLLFRPFYVVFVNRARDVPSRKELIDTTQN